VLDLPGEVARGQAEVLAGAVRVWVEWEAHALEPDQAEIAFARLAEPRLLIREEPPAIT